MTPAPKRTHTPATDAIHAAYMAKIEGRPLVDPHDLTHAREICKLARRFIYLSANHLQARPDLILPLKQASSGIKALMLRLEDELERAQRGAH